MLGDEALAMGLVDRVVEADALLDETVAYATDLATFCSPMAMAVVKTQIHEAMLSDFDTAVAAADARMLESFHRPDVTEGVTSYMENRPPEFPGLPPR